VKECTNPTHSDVKGATRECYACGKRHPEHAMRPFGRHAGHVLTWVCKGCSLPTPIETAPAPRLVVSA
jgi:Pyruvate/2-oxoacid:ferredoxin oxidoreductase delta subunit